MNRNTGIVMLLVWLLVLASTGIGYLWSRHFRAGYSARGQKRAGRAAGFKSAPYSVDTVDAVDTVDVVDTCPWPLPGNRTATGALAHPRGPPEQLGGHIGHWEACVRRPCTSCGLHQQARWEWWW